MAQNIITFQRPVGWTVYFQVRSNDTAWNGSAFVAMTGGAWTSLAVSMADPNGVGAYAGIFPAGIPAGSSYGVVAFKQTGGSPSPSDVAIGSANFSWDGTSLGAASINLAAPIPIRSQDSVTAPTLGDALLGAWTEAFGRETTDVATKAYVKKGPDGTAVRNYTLSVDLQGNVTAR
jgi:hypothetical protein